jgi:hypothetical protein
MYYLEVEICAEDNIEVDFSETLWKCKVAQNNVYSSVFKH